MSGIYATYTPHDGGVEGRCGVAFNCMEKQDRNEVRCQES